MARSFFCPCIIESPYERVLLIVGCGLLNALWPWPGIMPRKALTLHPGEGVKSSTEYQVA